MNYALVAFATVLGVTMISFTEYYSRTSNGVVEAMISSAPYVVVGQICLYYIFSSGQTLFASWIIFSLAMSAARLFNSAIILQEPLQWNWIGLGVALFLGGAICIKQAHQ